jgi:O-antigen/teichoic acid export membrane protein
MAAEKAKGALGRKLISGSALRLSNLGLAVVSALILMPLMVHRLGDRGYGFWALASAFIGYYGLIDFGLSSAVSQYLCIAVGRKDEAESGAVFNTALRIQSLLGGVALVVTAVLAALAHWICHNPADASLFWKVIVLLGINAALAFPARVYTGLLEAQLRFDLQSSLELLALVLRAGITAWVMLAGGGLLALSWAMLMVSLPVMALQVGLGRREAPWARIRKSSYGRKRTGEFFSYSIYTFGASLADMLRFQVDALVITALIGLAAVTHYRIASVLAKYFVSALVSITSLFQPVLSRLHGAGDHEKLERVFFFATKVSLCVSVFICSAVIGWGRPFVERWMGVRYEDAFVPMVLLALAVFLDVGQGPSVCLLYATFRHRYYTYMNAAEGVINLVFSLLLARPLGIIGVALGTLIGAAVIRVFVQPIVVCRVSGFAYLEYMRFLGNHLVRFLFFMGLAYLALHWAIRPQYGWLAGSVLCAGCIFAVGSWFLGFTHAERQSFRDAIAARAHRHSDSGAATVSL